MLETRRILSRHVHSQLEHEQRRFSASYQCLYWPKKVQPRIERAHSPLYTTEANLAHLSNYADLQKSFMFHNCSKRSRWKAWAYASARSRMCRCAQRALTAAALSCRFPILIWAFSVLPFLLSVLHLIKPSLVKRGSAALFAFAAVLQVFAVNTFHDLTTNATSHLFHTILVGNYVRIVGFSFMAAMSLLMIILESFMGHDEGTAHRTAAAHVDATGGKTDRDHDSKV